VAQLTKLARSDPSMLDKMLNMVSDVHGHTGVLQAAAYSCTAAAHATEVNADILSCCSTGACSACLGCRVGCAEYDINSCCKHKVSSHELLHRRHPGLLVTHSAES
jgi:hypothetical protein